MLSAALNIKNIQEELRKVPVKNLYDALRNPREATCALLRQLKIVRQLNPAQYAAIKQQLPYFVCASFNPPYRRTENFAYTEYFIIDIDHISDKGLLLSDLRKAITSDSRTMMCFVSPGGDGLKVLFRLSQRCYDAGLYKTFYKAFLDCFARQYAVEQVVDGKTCDVTRACFLSADAEAYYNPDAEPVVLADYVNPEADVTLAFDVKREMEQKEREASKQAAPKPYTEPTGDIMAQIRQALDMKPKRQATKAPAYVPEILNDIMDSLQRYVQDKGVVITDVINIQYGKKIRFKVGLRLAEINLFYGKRGFSVVQSPRTGTDTEANTLMADLVNCFLLEMM